MDLRKCSFEEIDQVKWNSCVHYATNGSIFAYHWFLKNSLREFDAIIEGDYRTVMPLINWNELSEEHLLRETGIFSQSILSKPRIDAFLDKAFQTAKLKLRLNQRIIPDLQKYEVTEIQNPILLLNKSKEDLFKGFNQELKDFTFPANWFFDSSLKTEKIVALAQENNPKLDSHSYHRIMYNALHRGIGFSNAVYDESKNVLAAVFFVFSHGRLTRLVHAYRDIEALKALFMQVFHLNAGKQVILDFNLMQEDLVSLFKPSTNLIKEIQRI